MARPAWEVLFQAEGGDFRQDVNKNIQVQRRFNQTIYNANRSFRQFNTFQARATNALRGFLAVAAGGGLLALGQGIIRMVDEVRVLEGQLRAGTEELGNFYQAQDQLRGLADQTNQGIDILTRGYSQLALSADRATLSHQNILVILETFSNAARIGGSSADDLSEALRQMGQAAAEGRVQWEDLTIIMDRLVGIRATLNRYASSRDTTLRQLTATGFSFDELLQALNQDRSRLQQSAGGAADTVANSFNRLVASIRQAVAQLDSLLGITEGISRGFDDLRDTIDDLDIERLAQEAFILAAQLRAVLDPLGKLFALIADSAFLKNVIVLLIRFADLLGYIGTLLVLGRFRGAAGIVGVLRTFVGNLVVLMGRLAKAVGQVFRTLIRFTRFLPGLRAALRTVYIGFSVFIESAGQAIAFLLLIIRIATSLGYKAWENLKPPENVQQSFFEVRNELRKLVNDLKRAKGEIGGESGFQRLLREALLLEGLETPQQQAAVDAKRLLDERVAKMREFLLQNKELSKEFVGQSQDLRDILLIFTKWEAEATFAAKEVERLEEALAKAEGSVEEGKINAELRQMRDRLTEANREVAHLRQLLGNLVDAHVRGNLEELEGAFKAIAEALRQDIAKITASIQGLKDELNSFVLTNDLRDAFEEVRDLLSIPDVGFSYETAQRGVRLIREGREELERGEELAEREVYRRRNSVQQAELELDLAKKKQELGEGNVQELQKEVKAKEELVKRSEEELANAEQARRLANDRLEAYNTEAGILEDILDTRGRIAFEQAEIIRLGQQANEAERLRREEEVAERRRLREEYINRLLQLQADLFQRIRQTVEQIGGNLLDQILLKTQSWGDFLRENLRLLAQFILRLTLIQPLANKVARALYPSGASAVDQLAGVSIPVVIPGLPATPDVLAPSGLGGRGSPKPVVIHQQITVDAVDASGIRRVLRSEAQNIAVQTAELIQGGRNYY